MRVVVLLKQVPDTYGERRLDLETGMAQRDGVELVLDEINERALEVALLYRDREPDTEVVVMTMGPESTRDVLRKGLSMGADSAVHILDDTGEPLDALSTARALAGALEKEGPDLIIAGNESTDGRGGVVPAMVAEFLGLPLLGSLDSAEVGSDRVSGIRILGDSRTTMSADLPAIITVTERAAEARFASFKGILTAKRKPVASIQPDLAGVAAPHWTVLSVSRRPQRAAGLRSTDDGDGGRRIAEFLRKRRAI
jgi:electron transfer flavoprotein beta subunit